MNTKTKELLIERVADDYDNTRAFRAVVMDRDEDTGARSVIDIFETERLETLLRCVDEGLIDELSAVEFRSGSHKYLSAYDIHRPYARKVLRRLACVMVGATPRTIGDAVQIVRTLTERKINAS